MLKKLLLLPMTLAILSLFVTSAYAEKPKVKSLYGASLCVTNYSNTMVRVSEGVFSNHHYFPPNTHDDIEPWGYTLFDVKFKYLASDGFYYPIDYCYNGNLRSYLTVTVYNSPYYPYYPYCANTWG